MQDIFGFLGMIEGSSMVKYFTVAPGNTSVDISGLYPAVTYDVIVMANNSIGQSEPSAVVKVTTGEEGEYD